MSTTSLPEGGSCCASTRGNGDNLQVAIVGSGSGACAAAIKAVERGAQVTLIEGADMRCQPAVLLCRLVGPALNVVAFSDY